MVSGMPRSFISARLSAVMVCSSITPSLGRTEKAVVKKSAYRSKRKCSKAPIDTIRSTGSRNCSQPINSTRFSRGLSWASNNVCTWSC